jgi:hypothetical protein
MNPTGRRQFLGMAVASFLDLMPMILAGCGKQWFDWQTRAEIYAVGVRPVCLAIGYRPGWGHHAARSYGGHGESSATFRSMPNCWKVRSTLRDFWE